MNYLKIKKVLKSRIFKDEISFILLRIKEIEIKYLLKFKYVCKDQDLNLYLESVNSENEINIAETSKGLLLSIVTSPNYSSTLSTISSSIDITKNVPAFRTLLQNTFSAFRCLFHDPSSQLSIYTHTKQKALDLYIVKMLGYLLNKQNELLLLLVPEIFVYIRIFETINIRHVNLSKIRYTITLIAIKFELFKFRLKNFFKENKNMRVFEDKNASFITLNFVLDIKMLILISLLSLWNIDETINFVTSAFITFLRIYQPIVLQELRIDERLFSIFFLYEKHKLNCYIRRYKEIDKKNYNFSYSCKLNEKCSHDKFVILTKKINCAEFQKINRKTIDKQFLKLLNTDNTTFLEHLMNYPSLATDLNNFLNEKIANLVNDETFLN